MRLTLKTEHLAELDRGDLAAVVAGQGLTGYYPTFDRDCGEFVTQVVTDVLTH